MKRVAGMFARLLPAATPHPAGNARLRAVLFVLYEAKAAGRNRVRGTQQIEPGEAAAIPEIPPGS